MVRCPLCGDDDFETAHAVEGHISAKDDDDHAGYTGADFRDDLGTEVHHGGGVVDRDPEREVPVDRGPSIEDLREEVREELAAARELEALVQQNQSSPMQDTMRETGDPMAAAMVGAIDTFEKSSFSVTDAALLGILAIGAGEHLGVTNFTEALLGEPNEGDRRL